MSALQPLLIEIGTEELPPLEMIKLRDALCSQLREKFKAENIPFGTTQTFVSPRRLAVLFQDIPTVQPDRVIEKKGPPVQAAFDAQKRPTQALLGFAKSVGVTIDDLKIAETDKGAWFMYQTQEQGKPTADIIPKLLKSVLSNLPANKTMRWADKTDSFVRPVHWIVLLHGETVIPVEAFGLQSDRLSYGHRIHGKNPFAIKQANDYEQDLLNQFVIADFEKRKTKIRQQIIVAAEKMNGQAVLDEDLIDEVCGLTEWPTAYLAQFSESFLAIPKEALISAMQKHQRCFAVKNTHTDDLLPCFILVSNLELTHPKNIIHGNERVMNARLTDAKFFYEQDKLTSLDSRLDLLRQMIFQKKLGTLHDKSQRIAKLAHYIGENLGLSAELCERAGLLCKTDLFTNMVGEFPELQGIMGHYYALNDKEDPAVANAIESHYYPRFSKDTLPADKISLTVALADRIDTLVGTFGIGFTPTSDKDPYALRRAALGVIRIIVESKLDLDLNDLIDVAIENYGNVLFEQPHTKLIPFIFERFRAYCLENGFTNPVFDAVLANSPTQPYDFYLRLKAVSAFITLDEAEELANAFKRVNNILVKSGAHAKTGKSLSVSTDLLTAPAEIILFEKISTLLPLTAPLIESRQYDLALKQLAVIKPEVDAFFETVMVNVEEEAIRKNRIHLLLSLRNLFVKIADLGLLS
jgi:glycyl-tRNA synthetase beta chain